MSSDYPQEIYKQGDEEDRAELEQPEPAPEAETCPANIGEVIELLSVWASYGTFKPHWPTINLANEYLQVLSRHPEVSPEALKMLLNWPKKLEVVLKNASTPRSRPEVRADGG